MGFLLENGVFTVMSEDIIDGAKDFSCGHPDLDDFFQNDCIAYSKSLFGKTYCFHTIGHRDDVICAFTVSNASIFTNRLPTSRKKKIGKVVPFEKRDLIYPAVLIGRLGTNSKYQHNNVGTELMDFIKAWFTEPRNKTGCRYLVVDAYNTEIPISYYRKNGFDFMFSSEEQEKEYRNLSTDEDLKTRLMFFDLIRIID